MLQNFIELLSIPFGAGESRLLHVSGQYFEIIDATNPVDVLLIDKTGAQRGIMRGAEASFHLKNTDFSTIQITSPTAQTIRIGYGSGEAGTRRAAGAVSIVGTVPVSGPLTDAQLRASVVDVRARPEGGNGLHSATGALAANAYETLIAPGANVNGALLLYAACNDVKATEVEMMFLHKAAAPATIYDGAPLLASKVTGLTTSLYSMGGQLETPAFIPAGAGLYFIVGAASTALCRRHARWRLL